MEEKKQDTKATEKKDTKPVEKKEEKKATSEVKKEVKKDTKKQETPKNDTKKKFETKKVEKKPINHEMIIGIAVITIVIVAIIACVVLMGNSPKKAVDKMLKDLKSGNYSQGMLSDIWEEENLDQEARKLLFDKLEWKIQKVKEEGNKATIEIEITNKDFKTIINNYMQKVLKLAFSGQSMNDEEMTNYLVEELKNEEVETTTSSQSIIVEKKDGKWEITEEKDFVNILLPGFNDAVSAFK